MLDGIRKGFGFTVGMTAGLLALPVIAMSLLTLLGILAWIATITVFRLIRDQFRVGPDTEDEPLF